MSGDRPDPSSGAPGAPDIRLERAEALADLGRWDDAVTAAGRVVAERPHDLAALSVLARSQLGAGRARDAWRSASAAVAVEPEVWVGHALMSVAAAECDDEDTSLRAAREAVRLAPDLAQAHLIAARALLRVHRAAQAVASAETAVRLAPPDADAHTVLGLALHQQRDRAGAREAYHEALRLDPASSTAMNNLAVLDLEGRRLGRGARRVASGLRLDPQDATLQANLDVVGDRLLSRLLNAMLLSGFLLFVALGVEASQAAPSRLPRTLVGVALLGVYATVVWSTLRHLPPGMRRRLRGLPRRSPHRWRWVMLAVLSVSLLVVAFAPGDAAFVGAAVALGVIRIAQLLLLVAVVRGVWRWVRRTVTGLRRTGRDPVG